MARDGVGDVSLTSRSVSGGNGKGLSFNKNEGLRRYEHDESRSYSTLCCALLMCRENVDLPGELVLVTWQNNRTLHKYVGQPYKSRRVVPCVRIVQFEL